MAGQNGLLDYRITGNSMAEMTFGETFVPNVDVIGVWFNGKTYVSGGSAHARFNYESNRITLELETDKAAYKPGEQVKVRIKALRRMRTETGQQ